MHNDNSWLWNLNVPHNQNLPLANTVAIDGLPLPSPSSRYINTTSNDLGICVGMRNVKLHCDNAQLYSPKLCIAQDYNVQVSDSLTNHNQRLHNFLSCTSNLQNNRVASQHHADSILENTLSTQANAYNSIPLGEQIENLENWYSRIQQLALPLPPLISASSEHSRMEHRNLYSSDVAAYYFDNNLKSSAFAAAATNHMRKERLPTTCMLLRNNQSFQEPLNVSSSSAILIENEYMAKPRFKMPRQLPMNSKSPVNATQRMISAQESQVVAPKKKWIRTYIKSKFIIHIYFHSYKVWLEKDLKNNSNLVF